MEGRKVGTKGEKEGLGVPWSSASKPWACTGAISDSKTPYFRSVRGPALRPRHPHRSQNHRPQRGRRPTRARARAPFTSAPTTTTGAGAAKAASTAGPIPPSTTGPTTTPPAWPPSWNLARRFHDSPLQNTVVFIAFSGEEMGLWGSNAFAKEHLGAFPAPRFMVNMDMVGRLNAERQLAVYGTGTSPLWDGLLDEQNCLRTSALKREVSGVGPIRPHLLLLGGHSRPPLLHRPARRLPPPFRRLGQSQLRRPRRCGGLH